MASLRVPQWVSTIFSMHLESVPPILISQVQLQRFGALAAVKGWVVWAGDGCVKLPPTVLPAFCSPELKEFPHNAIRQMKILKRFWTSLSQGSSVRIKDAFVMPVYQKRRCRKIFATLSHNKRKETRKKNIQMKRPCTVFFILTYFLSNFFPAPCMFVCADSSWNTPRLFESIKFFQWALQALQDYIVKLNNNSKHMKILRLISIRSVCSS